MPHSKMEANHLQLQLSFHLNCKSAGDCKNVKGINERRWLHLFFPLAFEWKRKQWEKSLISFRIAFSKQQQQQQDRNSLILSPLLIHFVLAGNEKLKRLRIKIHWKTLDLNFKANEPKWWMREEGRGGEVLCVCNFLKGIFPQLRSAKIKSGQCKEETQKVFLVAAKFLHSQKFCRKLSSSFSALTTKNKFAILCWFAFF
jgi:hypothetical protein